MSELVDVVNKTGAIVFERVKRDRYNTDRHCYPLKNDSNLLLDGRGKE